MVFKFELLIFSILTLSFIALTQRMYCCESYDVIEKKIFPFVSIIRCDENKRN
jgi:hypothetical protein